MDVAAEGQEVDATTLREYEAVAGRVGLGAAARAEGRKVRGVVLLACAWKSIETG